MLMVMRYGRRFNLAHARNYCLSSSVSRGNPCSHLRVSPPLTSQRFSPDWRCPCSPGSPSSSRAEAERSPPSLWPPPGSGWTWPWNTRRKRRRRTSWPATQRADSPADPPTTRCGVEEGGVLMIQRCLGIDRFIFNG